MRFGPLASHHAYIVWQSPPLPRCTSDMASKIIPASWRSISASTTPSIARYTRQLSTAPRHPLATKRTSPLLSTARLTPLLAPHPPPSTTIRCAHSVPRPGTSSPPEPNTPRQPSYELTFTCNPCGTRSAHNISKQGYHHGTVLITCPTCRNRHIISDHLKIFGDEKMTIEELMKERGQLVKRGTLGEDGDLELWEDGSTTSREERTGEGEGKDPLPKAKAQADGAEGESEAPGSTFGKS